MLILPQSQINTFNIIGLDPGSDTFGIAILTIDIATMLLAASDALTISGDKLAGKDSWVEQTYGPRMSRIMAIEKKLLEIFNYHQPTIIVSESPFINMRFPQAGVSLTEVMTMIKRTVMNYDQWKT